MLLLLLLPDVRRDVRRPKTQHLICDDRSVEKVMLMITAGDDDGDDNDDT